MTGKMLSQTGQGGIDAHVTRTSREIIEQTCRRRRTVAPLGPPVVVKELHQAAVGAAEPAVGRQFNGGVASRSTAPCAKSTSAHASEGRRTASIGNNEEVRA